MEFQKNSLVRNWSPLCLSWQRGLFLCKDFRMLGAKHFLKKHIDILKN